MGISIVTGIPTIVCILYTYCKLGNKNTLIEGHQVQYYTCGLLSCLLASSIELLKAADDLLKGQVTQQISKIYFYIHITHTTLYEWLGICLLLANFDVVYLVYKRGVGRSRFTNRTFVKVACFLSCALIFGLNCLTGIHVIEAPPVMANCSAGLSFEIPKTLTSKFNIGVIVWLLTQMIIIKGFFAYRLLFRRFIEKQPYTKELYERTNSDPVMVDKTVQTSAVSSKWALNTTCKSISVINCKETLGNRVNLLDKFRDYLHRLWSSVTSDKPSRDLHGETNSSFNDSDERVHPITSSRRLSRRSGSIHRHMERKKSTSSKIGDLLYYMMTAYGDTDVADKAKFYYALMTGAADPKLKLVLQDIQFDKESVHEALSSILPGNTEKQSLAKIIPLEKTIFDWDRVSDGTSAILLEKKRTLPTATEVSEEFLLYLDHLSKHDFSVDICCRLTLREDSEFDTAHAITVHIDPAEHLHDVPDIHVACLQKLAHHDIVVKLRPVLPLPQRLTFHVEFACDQKKTYSVKLPCVDVQFEQFLLPLPWKPNVECQSKFFTNMWLWLLGDENNKRGDGIESVKAFEVSAEKFEQVHQKHLKRFLLGEQHSFQLSNYAIFLPPHHHILLQCLGQKDNRLVISIAMTTWTMLPHVDKLLDNFMR